MYMLDCQRETKGSAARGSSEDTGSLEPEWFKIGADVDVNDGEDGYKRVRLGGECRPIRCMGPPAEIKHGKVTSKKLKDNAKGPNGEMRINEGLKSAMYYWALYNETLP